MIRFLKSLFIFACFTSIVYVLSIVLFGYFVPLGLRSNLPFNLGGIGYSYTRFKEAKNHQNADVLVLGSSHAYRGYDPRIFKKQNWSMFNLGSSAQTPKQTAYVLKRYLANFHPKLVIFDLYPVLFKSDGVESTVDLLSNTALDEELLDLSLAENNIRVYNTMVYRVCHDMFGFNKGFAEKSPDETGDTYVKGGYVESFQQFKPKAFYKEDAYELDEEQLEALQDIVHTLKDHHIPYILLQSPLPKSRYDSFVNNHTVDSIFRNYGTYKNANEVLSVPDSCFFDQSHLNQRGVNIYNEYVVKLIKQGKYLSDEHLAKKTPY